MAPNVGGATFPPRTAVVGHFNVPATIVNADAFILEMDITLFLRTIRGFAEASLVALGFALAILLIGAPIALIVRGLHEGFSWLAALW